MSTGKGEAGKVREWAKATGDAGEPPGPWSSHADEVPTGGLIPRRSYSNRAINHNPSQVMRATRRRH